MVEFNFIDLVANGLAPANVRAAGQKRVEESFGVSEFRKTFDLSPSGLFLLGALNLTLRFEIGEATAAVTFCDRGGEHKNGTLFLMRADTDERAAMEARIRKYTNTKLPPSPLAVLVRFDVDPTLSEQADNAAAAFFSAHVDSQRP
jgi:hypothetical protein